MAFPEHALRGQLDDASTAGPDDTPADANICPDNTCADADDGPDVSSTDHGADDGGPDDASHDAWASSIPTSVILC